MKIPKVSIIIPVYNGEKKLIPCLNSILRQTYADFEVILVDNNSIDKTKELIHEFAAKDMRIKYLFEKEQTRGAARNTGEKNAVGAVILMTDSDCILYPDWIRKLAVPVINKECDAVQGGEEPLVNDFWSQQMMLRERAKVKDKPLGNIDTKNFAISRQALEKIGFTSRKYFSGNDTELGIRIQMNNLKVKFLDNIRVGHKNESSLKGVAKKYFKRAQWCVILSEDNRDYLKQTEFLEQTNQTAWSFFKFFPGLLPRLIKKGFKYAYFELVTGISWRLGIISGKVLRNDNKSQI